MKKSFKLLLLFAIIVASGTLLAVSKKIEYVHANDVSSGTLTFTTEACGGDSDNKDHDTQVYVEVYGSHGTIIATENYTDDVEFPDNGSQNTIPLNIGDPGAPGVVITDDNLPIQKILVRITPNGHDTWTFDHLVAAFNSGTYALNTCVKVTQDRRTAVIVSNPGADFVQYP